MTFFSRNMTTSPRILRNKTLAEEDIRYLESQGCSATDWSGVIIAPGTDLSLLSCVRFEGEVSIGRLTCEEGRRVGIHNALIADSKIGNQVYIKNISSGISGYRVSDRVRIEDVGSLEGLPGASCGVGTEVSVLDETGSRAVRIVPGLSASLALLLAMNPRWAEEVDYDSSAASTPPALPSIGTGAEILGCGRIFNVRIDRDVKVSGAELLENGSIVNNAPRGVSKAYVGTGVIARNFIIEDGIVDTGARIFNTYVGQCAIVSNGFMAHDSLFFANSHCENGEACAVIAGPYTVSMHKSTLLIGAVYSFMNAGSGTNFSNHLYKLGPVHWGIAERGVKTSSGGYVMWGAKIGAYSLVMGQHKTHPDTSRFPFSYLFGDSDGKTTVSPGRMLTSSGLMRDERKWPMRDSRVEARLPLHDRIDFETLNPVTVGRMIDAVEYLRGLDADSPGHTEIDGMILRHSSIEKGIKYYLLAIKKYFYEMTRENGLPSPFDAREGEWVDVCGQLLPRSVMERVVVSDSLEEAVEILDEASADREAAERGWIAWRFRDGILDEMADAAEAAAEFDALREKDRKDYVNLLASENKMLRL